MKNKLLYLFALLIFTPYMLKAQKATTYFLVELYTQGKLEIKNRNVSVARDDNKSFLKIADTQVNDGVIWLPISDFRNGKIEMVARGKDIHQGSFYGIAFHTLNDTTYDGVYCRPFNFKAEDSERKIHAVQYVSYPDFDWQRLRKERNGQYEKGVSDPPNADDWVTLTVEIRNETVKAYINHRSEPSLVVKKLNDRTGGKIGITGINSDVELVRITNFD